MQKFLVVVVHVTVISLLEEVRGQDEISHVSHNMGKDGYVFEYSVVDSDSSWMQSHGEWSDGISTHGSYNVKLPDGRIQKVIYTADEDGFKPVISYENPIVSLGGYGWKNHIIAEDVDKYDDDNMNIMKSIYHGNGFQKNGIPRYFEEDSYDDDDIYGHPPPPFYQMTKFYDTPAHRLTPSGRYDPNMSYEPQEGHLKEGHHPTKSSYKLPASPLHSPSLKKATHPVHHMVEKYQQGLVGYPKYTQNTKDLHGKYPVGKAKTYYMNESEKETHMSSSSEEDEDDNMRQPGKMSYMIAKLKKETGDMTHDDDDDDNMMMENMSFEHPSHTLQPASMHHKDLDESGEGSEMKEESYEESSEESEEKEEEREESSEEYDNNKSETEEEEEEEEEKSHYMTMMISMLPPNKPYVPPTYFPPSPSPSTSSSYSSPKPNQPSLPAPSTAFDESMESLDTPPSPKSLMLSSAPTSSSSSESSSSYQSEEMESPPLNMISTSLYSPYHSPYAYHEPHYTYHHIPPYHHPHLSPYKPSSPSLYHVRRMPGSSLHPYSQHHYPPPSSSKLSSRYSLPYSLSGPRASYTHPQMEVSRSA